MNEDKNASLCRLKAGGAVLTLSLLVVGIASAAISSAWGQEVVAPNTLPKNTVLANITVGNLPQGVVVSPESNSVYVANSLSNTVSVINAQSNTVENTISVGQDPEYLAISADGTKLYVSQFTSPGAVTVIDLANGNSEQTITVSAYPIGIALSPDGSQLWVAAGDIDRIDITKYSLLSPITVPGGCQSLAFTPDGKKVYASGRYTGKIMVVSTATGNVTKEIQFSPSYNSEEPAGFAISGSAAYVLVDLGDNNLVGWLLMIDTVTDKLVKRVKLGWEAGDVPALLPDAPYLYIPEFEPPKVTLFDTQTKALLRDGVTSADGPYDVAIARNGARAYLTDEFANAVTVIGIK